MKKLSQIIHIAKNQLGLDDDTYRALLSSVVPGKTSCRDMSASELQQVIKAFEGKGFKSQPSRQSKRRMSKPSDISKKIRMVWKAMFADGFLRDGSDIALDHFVQRHTSQKNGGKGVSSLEWLRGDLELNFLEGLKQWHIRAMKKTLVEHNAPLPVYPDTGEVVRDYDVFCAAYAEAAKRWNK
ncbi:MULTISPECIES: gp16 family protein [Citrobacter]|uniref:gp16 family protein n=1 Tax=Citrobacter TaxID=544 RepID=UPI000E3E3B5F|nr:MULTISPECIES: regulatory protein GemA [Citrobacter]EKN6166708.1 regulatory protein GemA [Yersinia enterocolitica]HBU9893148.1 regulatory protein GemA [Citrobacter freundii]EKN6394966.1 regulatory protein GemA [Yersinia enterocolitica]EKN6408450.1 regulatory protein GemA [Yersinia enterocolitica]ELY5222440.1 regulatory protein GemA [Yersinia enterocolitica]